MTESCPSDLALDDDEIHGGGDGARLASHLAACSRCQARQRERRRLTDRFDLDLAATAWQRLAAARRRRRRFWLAGLSLPVAAAAFILARFGDPSPPPLASSYRGVKGVLAIEVTARRAGTAFRVDEATPIRPGDELQFTVRPGARDARYVLVGSVDGTGHFSPFYPAEDDGDSAPLPPPGVPLAPPIVIDPAPGPERVVVLVSSRPLSVPNVRTAVLAAAGTQQPIGAIGDVPVVSAWMILAKEGRGP